MLLVFMLFFIDAVKPSLRQPITMFGLGVFLLAYSVSLEVRGDGVCFKHLKLFGLTIVKTKHRVINPEVIRVFPAFFKNEFNWGPIAAMCKQSKNVKYVVRLFNQNKHWTVFKTNSFDKASLQAKKLGAILNIKVETQK